MGLLDTLKEMFTLKDDENKNTSYLTDDPTCHKFATDQLLKRIDAGKLEGFISGDAPIILTKNEIAVAVFENTPFWESRSVSVRHGGSRGASIRVMKRSILVS